MNHHATEADTLSPLITRTEEVHNVNGQLASLGYHSVFDIVRMPREHFIKQHRRTLGRDTGKIYDLAIGYAHQVARSFRKNRLARAVSRSLRGPFSVSGPDYSSQFPDEAWTGLSPTGAPEANDSVVHYAAALYQLAQEREGDEGVDTKVMNTLATRRPDLASLIVDDKAINEEIPQLQVVTEVLCAAIQATDTNNLTSLSAVNEKLSTTRYPNSFPFDFGNVQLQAAQREMEATLQDLTQSLAADVPTAWLSPTTALTNNDLNRLQIMACGLSPEQQRIITETDTDLATDLPGFYERNFGRAELTAVDFADMDTLTARTGLTVPEVEQLLSVTVGGQQVIASPNCGTPVTGSSMYGSVYILGLQKPIIAIKKDAAGALSLSPSPSDTQLMHINRMVRLQRWLGLPYEDVDLLLISSIHATGEDTATCPLGDNTLRMLGLFRRYQRQYGTTARQFAAWLHQLSPYAITPATPFFDQIFNASSAFDMPFQVDSTAFHYRTTDGADGLRGKQIMAALGLNQRQFLLLADKIAKCQNGKDAAADTLTCDLNSVTAFYRIASLAKTLGLSVDEFCALVDMLDADGQTVWKQLAGNPEIAAPHKDITPASDILCLLQALSWLVDWQKQAKLSVATISLLCGPLPATSGTDAQLSFIQQIWQRLPATFVDAGLLNRSGAPLKEDTEGHQADIDWFALLGTAGLIDEAGLVTEVFTAEAVGGVVDGQALTPESTTQANTALTAALQQAQATQSGIAITALAQALNVSQSLPALLLRWADKTPYQWLKVTWGISPDAPVGEYIPLTGRFGATMTEKDYNLLAADWRDVMWDPATGALSFVLRCSFDCRDGVGGNITDNWLVLPDGITCSTPPTLSSGNWPSVTYPNKNYDGKKARALFGPGSGARTNFVKDTVYYLDVSLQGTFTDLNTLASLPLTFGMHQYAHSAGNLNTTWTLKNAVTTVDTLPGDWLTTLRDIARRSMVCNSLQLSPAGLQTLLKYPEWFNLSTGEVAGGITLQTLYRLSRYAVLLTMVGSNDYTEDDLLAYLRDVNAPTPLTSDEATTTLAALLGWEAGEVAATFASGALGHTAGTLSDLDVVMNLQRSTQASGLAVEQLAQGFTLSRDNDYAAWSRAGQALVSRLRHLDGR